MANTTNLNLVKLAGTEKLKTFPNSHNGNLDAIDAAFGAGFGVGTAPNVNTSINNLADGLAIVSDNNTHAAITSGQYVYVRNHGSLAEGLYVATANIAANGTLSGSNLTADSSGGLNSLNSKLTDKIKYMDITISASAGTKAFQINSGSGNVVSYTNFLNALVLDTNSREIQIYTYANLVYCQIYDISARTTPLDINGYKIRVFYMT